MEKTFYFIDGLQPDRTSKKLMRRHVMKGKNAGKKVHRASREGLSKDLHLIKAVNTSGLHRMSRNDDRSADLGPVDRKFGDTILTSAFPIAEVNRCSLNIINQFFDLTTERLYPISLGFSLCEVKLLWLRLVFTDEAAYHCNISLMQACNEIYLGNGTSSPKALYHLSQTFTHIQRRLGSCDALSDSTMGLIVSLIMQEQIRGQGPATEVHARGLQKMVELRGGLSDLDRNLTLALKVCKTDIMLSLQYGRPTMFFRDHMAEVWNKLASDRHRLYYAPVTPWNDLHPYLNTIYSDIMNLCYLLNCDPYQPILDLLGFEETFVSICYRLLRFIPMENSACQVDTQTACHLGLLMFTMTTFFQVGQKQIIDFKALSLRFQNFLDSDPSELEDSLSLWLITLGGIWCSKDLNRDLAASRIRLLAQKHGIFSWNELRGCLGKFPWIHALHDQPGLGLWNQVQRSH
ncbi:hypothetical protein BDV38DRAFT_69075 [Aspergillus pseudotamarii]|uniref:Fungal-specific transcription factor domain-containing protein n=1 Tax=Aspergillus pseudotamarii TaxID=132259 RepID=A0A5N6SVC7_ASPPS|nr:uncharacterized protein BDV38DRAFT_69075 [Aspergillus pseudotamarii]KAE8138646.1 hypothetical protein BDV38DRAFT_69075 [Aspergillus pseudotamarii]